jgi:ABC-type dipeptide/oligopeptide/nickel transport system permease subunit
MAIEDGIPPVIEMKVGKDVKLVPERKYGLIILRRLFRKRSAQVGVVIIIMLIFCAIFGPWITPRDPFRIKSEVRLSPPSLQYPFGTDEQGRDIFSRIIYGSRYTVLIMLTTTAVASILGVTIALPSAYFGGWLDTLVMRIMDILLGFPYILLILAIVAVIGPNLLNAMIAIGIAYIPDYARLARSTIITVRDEEYVAAERALGASNLRIMVRTILPNILSPIIIYISLTLPIAILSAAALSFLGLGAQPPTPEWGAMMVNARDFLTTAPWVVLAPGLAIFVCVLGINLFGNGVRDVLDPRENTRK